LTTGTPKFRGSGFVGMHVKPITAQEKFNFPRANAILARAQALLWVRDCLLYQQKQVDDVNVARYNIFRLGKYCERDMPCTKDVLRKHLNRVVYQSFNSHYRLP
jgi:hypothetical protein